MGSVGLEACELFASAGATVIAIDLAEDEGGKLAKDFKDRSLNVEFRVLDVTSSVGIAGLSDYIKRTHGHVDVLINNAGILSFSPIMATSVLEWDRVQDINCKSAFLMIRAIVPLMDGAGVIVNMSSVAATNPTIGSAAYSISKAGMIVLTQVAALELGPGIRVVAISPGGLDTQMPKKYLAGHPEKDAIMEGMANRTILKRLGTAREAAAMTFFIASDAASYMTGTTVNMDGGTI